MIILACLMIAAIELLQFLQTVLPYTEDLDAEIFLIRAPLDRIVKAQMHIVSMAQMLVLATIVAAAKINRIIP